jgi:hypothetical protein
MGDGIRMLKKTTILSCVLFMLFTPLAMAHPGRTDASGGHTCRTNCEKWGLKYGEYHYHNGGHSSSSSSNPSNRTIDSRSEKEKEADGYVWLVNFYKKQGSYYNAFYYIEKVYETGYSYKIDSFMIRDVATSLSADAYGLFTDGDLATSLQEYQLLAKGRSTPYDLAQNAKTNAKLIEDELQFRSIFGEALWYYNEGNYLNAVLIASKKMDEGNVTSASTSFMNRSATKLNEKAYASFLDKDYEFALKCYSVLSYTKYVPEDIKASATTNVKVVKGYIH